jgi:hypothetical protein
VHWKSNTLLDVQDSHLSEDMSGHMSLEFKGESRDESLEINLKLDKII